MKPFKKIALVATLSMGVLFVAALAFPFLFKEQLIDRAKKLINESILAEVGFSDVSISLIRDFPNVSMQLKQFKVDGTGVFKDVRLLEADYLQASIDLRTVFNRNIPLRVNEIHLESPMLHILVTEDGLANYDIAKPAPVPPPGADTLVIPASEQILATLERITVNSASLSYDDASIGLAMSLQGLTHESHGDVSAARYVLDTYTKVDSLTVDYGGIRYLDRAESEVTARFDVNQDSSMYRISENTMRINDLNLSAQGFLRFLDVGYDMDFSIAAPDNAFRDLVSLIPGVYMQGFEDLESQGQFALSALIRGTYSDSLNLYPAYDMRFRVMDGSIKYPSLPLGINHINADMHLYNAHSELDSMRLDIPRIGMSVGKNPIEAIFHLSTPISDPTVDGRLKGKLDLAELSKAFPMQPLKGLTGRIEADITAKASMSQLDKKQYQSVQMQGNAIVEELQYKQPSQPTISIKTLRMAFSPAFVQIDQLQARYGKSDLRGSGRVDNILAYFSPRSTMRGNFTLRSRLLDVNESLSKSSTPSKTQSSRPSASAVTQTPVDQSPTEYFTRFDFKIDAIIDQLNYEAYQVRDIIANGQIKPNRFVVQKAAAAIGNSDIQMSGVITDAYDYLFNKGKLGGAITIQSRNLDLNQFMAYVPAPAPAKENPSAKPTGSSTPSALPANLLVPERINLNINAQVGNLTYTDFNIKSMTGTMELADQTIALKTVEGETLGGKIAFAGLYDTRDPLNPEFRAKLDLAKMDFQQSFKALNTFSALAPIGQFLSGIFSSSVLLEGTLGKNMLPRLDKLSAKGFLETLNATIRGFKPLQVLATQLNIQELKEDLRITDTKNWIEVANGVVEVKPFEVTVKEIQLTIAGTHRLDNKMDYDVKARVPRAIFEKSSIGAAASSAVKQVSQQAARLGINIAQGDYVNLLVKMTGTIQDPKVSIKLLGMDGKSTAGTAAKAAIESQLEAQKKQAEAQLQKGVEQAKEAAGKALDTVSQRVKAEAEKKKAELEAKAKETVEKEIGKPLADSVRKQAEKVLDQSKAKEEVDKVKKELEKFNPFKKKTTTPDSTRKNE